MSQATEAAVHALEAGRTDHAVALVERALQAGDVDAIALMALWRLLGSPVARDLAQARRLLRAAAQAGDTVSAMMEIALTANGTGAASSWPQALALLEQQAARSNAEAQAHLALLASMDLDPDGKPRRLPEPAILSHKPLVRHWPGLLTKEECAHLATSVLDLLEPSMVADPRTGRQIAHPVRRSSAAVIGPTRETLPIQAIQRRIAAATQTTVSQGEPLAVLHYAPGQEYLPHMDTLPNQRNQRIATALIYLNEGYAGGETHFPASGLSIVGKLGDVVAFSNVAPDGQPDPASRHAGLPIQRGVKWLATRWIRQAPLDIWGVSS
jgi:prolyl 4-hydroxylase